VPLVTFEQLITQHRSYIEQVVQGISRRYHLSAGEAAEFALRVERALERNDYELLRAYDNRSTWETYLTTVITQQFFTFQAELWGQWRPSGVAKRMGSTAILLEELMLRDRLSFNEAIEVMRRVHRVDQPRHRLEALADGLGLLLREPEPRSLYPDADVGAREALMERALRDALTLLAADERLMLTMRFVDGSPVTRIAQLMNMQARPVQRRIEQAKEVVRMSLLTQGLGAVEIDALLGETEQTGRRLLQKKLWVAVAPYK
jgi:DNA-directed RNA polymerase specialized sigma24 family protein